MTATVRPRPEQVIAAWKEWDVEPGNHTRAIALEATCRAYVGEYVTDFRVHVAAWRRAGRTYEAAVYSWDPA